MIFKVTEHSLCLAMVFVTLPLWQVTYDNLFQTIIMKTNQKMLQSNIDEADPLD